MSINQAFIKLLVPGLKAFNEGDYWQCHEELEHWWLEHSYDPDRFLPWAILQCAVALYHFKGGNIEGAKGMIRRSFEKCQNGHLTGPELAILDWESFKNLVQAASLNPNDINFENLMNFRFPLEESWKY